MSEINNVIVRIDLEDPENPELYYVPEGYDAYDLASKLRSKNDTEMITYNVFKIQNINENDQITILSDDEIREEQESFDHQENESIKFQPDEQYVPVENLIDESYHDVLSFMAKLMTKVDNEEDFTKEDLMNTFDEIQNDKKKD